MIHLADEGRAGFVGIIAHGNNVVKVAIEKFIDTFRLAETEINPLLAHHLDGKAMHRLGRFCARRKNLKRLVE